MNAKITLSAGQPVAPLPGGGYGIPVEIREWSTETRADVTYSATAVLTTGDVYALIGNLLSALQAHPSTVAHIERLAVDEEYASRFRGEYRATREQGERWAAEQAAMENDR